MGETKIVITIGPSSMDDSMLGKLIRYGASVVRVNTAHAEIEDVKKISRKVNKLNRELKKHVGVMLDLKGPELRTADTENFVIRSGRDYYLSNKKENGSSIVLNKPGIIKSLRENDNVLMSDGKIRFRVLEIENERAKIRALNDGILRDHARVNIPGRYIEMGLITERDREFLREGIKNGVDFFALSFVQNSDNVKDLQKLIMEYSGDQAIVSKIETKSGVENIEGIVKASDAIMVARGDLGVELPLEEIGIVQKRIIKESHKYGVPTIVATQMLESMVNESTPTRAEVSDVTNAILDNTDAVMLSEETAIGKNPDLAVLTMKKIIDYVESIVQEFPEPEEFLGNRIAFSIAKASKVIAREIDADGILGFTSHGNTAKMLSAVRPGLPVYMAVTTEQMARRLNMLRSIYPFVIGKDDLQDMNKNLMTLQRHFNLKKGTRLVVTSGLPYFVLGGTNSVMVIPLGEFLGRGYSQGKSFRGKITISGKNGDILLVKEKVIENDERFLNYRGIIFTEDVSISVKEFLERHRINALYNTKLYVTLKEGEDVIIDGYTGTIIR